MSPAESVGEDARLAALRDWLEACLPGPAPALEPASADASFRRYFRVARGQRSWIAMDAPPEREDSAAFVRVAGLLRDAGLHAPEIHAMDLERGFMLLEDLGATTYLEALDAHSADRLFADALAALVDWQTASSEAALPAYDAATLERELALFPDWFVARHLEVNLDAGERRDLDAAFAAIVERALAQPRVFVHRDYMPRNLMLSTPNPGILDFQDARFGPLAYDPISLFKDAFVSWPAERVDIWLTDYWRRAEAVGLPVPPGIDLLRRDCDWMGLQRHLKVLGIFARIRYRDGKPRYLQDAPRFIAYIRPVLVRYPELAGLAAIFDRHVAPAFADGSPP